MLIDSVSSLGNLNITYVRTRASINLSTLEGERLGGPTYARVEPMNSHDHPLCRAKITDDTRDEENEIELH